MAIHNAWQLALPCIKLRFHFTERFHFKQCVSMTKTPVHFATYEQSTRLLNTHTLLFLYRAPRLISWARPASPFVNFVLLPTLYKFAALRQGMPYTKIPLFFCKSHKTLFLPFLHFLLTTFLLYFVAYFLPHHYFPSSFRPFLFFIFPLSSIVFVVFSSRLLFLGRLWTRFHPFPSFLSKTQKINPFLFTAHICHCFV